MERRGGCDFFCSLYFNYVCVITPFPFSLYKQWHLYIFSFKKGFNPIMTCFTYMQQCWDICFCLGSRDVGNPVPCIRPSKNLHVFLHILCWIQHPLKEIKKGFIFWNKALQCFFVSISIILRISRFPVS